ncbi:glycosyltransferase family 4 protein [Alginatibacterium sediminis]|uniref:Glycosyltransferase family 4 protein n=1 Tax=Alginatibacterium sediminis TaxID=2164068 RepID=A0A420EN48_9ALTE|nr:glycosyltransferase [Alginatibacterium sediminis]RKF22155.1 glycosyltransferase family 4 protein [Alginatibacterium sediminis]
MKILLYIRAKLPVVEYGGTERVVWDLGFALQTMGHQVTFLALKGTICDWASVQELNPTQSLESQVPDDIDLVHFHSDFEDISKPYVITQHGHCQSEINPNTIFVSKKHAQIYGAQCYVYNGLNWNNYQGFQTKTKQERFHFLGKAAWRAKNVQGAIDISKAAGKKLDVMGGYRFNFKMGIRLSLDSHVRFWGMVNDHQKADVMQSSKGLIFPVTWHEPFGLAITESLYYGCPVFATTHGSLPELIDSDVGYLSNVESELVQAVSDLQFSALRCHEYARDQFNADVMAKAYLDKYEKVLNAEVLNELGPRNLNNYKKLAYLRQS